MKKIVISFGVLLLLLVVVLAFTLRTEGFENPNPYPFSSARPSASDTPKDYCNRCCLSGQDTCDCLYNCKC